MSVCSANRATSSATFNINLTHSLSTLALAFLFLLLYLPSLPPLFIISFHFCSCHTICLLGYIYNARNMPQGSREREREGNEGYSTVSTILIE